MQTSSTFLLNCFIYINRICYDFIHSFQRLLLNFMNISKIVQFHLNKEVAILSYRCQSESNQQGEITVTLYNITGLQFIYMFLSKLCSLDAFP